MINIKKFLAIIAGITLLFSFVGIVSAKPDNHDNDNKDNHDQISCTKSWNLTGTWNFVNDSTKWGGTYNKTMTITQDSNGNITGTGNNVPPGNTWNVAGKVNGNSVTFTLSYDAPMAGYVATFVGTISSSGMSGTWSDVWYSDTGSWHTTSGSPVLNLPVNKDQCKKDGWKDFGVFKNQGQCVSYVERCNKDNDQRSCNKNGAVVNPAQLQVHVTYYGDWYYTAAFVRTGTHLSGWLTDGYVQPSALTGPILNGSIVGNHVVFSFDYGPSSVQGVRTYDGTIQINGDLTGTWSQTGSQSTGQSFPFVISNFAIKMACVND